MVVGGVLKEERGNETMVGVGGIKAGEEGASQCEMVS